MERSPRFLGPLVAAALVVVTLAVYAQVADFEFVRTDDGTYVSKNPQVKAGLARASVAWAFTTFEASNWHPLTWLSLMLDAEIGGAGPRVFHVTNLVLHTANAVLLFFVLATTTRRTWRSAFVAALFAVHPLHVESVAWVSERKDVLSTLLWLLATLAYVRYARRPRPLAYALVVVALALGLMAKPMLVTLPLVLLLMDWWPLGRLDLRGPPSGLRRVVVEKVPLLALTVASCVVTLQAQWRVVGTLEHFPFALRFANAVTAYAWYLVKTVWPAGLAMPYPYDRDPSPWLVAGSAVLLLAVTALAARCAARHPYVLFGWLWYVGTLVPVIGLVQVGTQPVADRYTYVPLIGPFVMIAWGVPALVRLGDRGRKGARAGVAVAAVAVVVALASAAHAQARHWRDSEALFARALAVTENNVLAHNGMGSELDAKGRTEEAVRHFRAALRINPAAEYARRNLATIMIRTGDLDEAARLCREELQMNPASVAAHEVLAVVLTRRGAYGEAVAHYREALRRRPDAADTRTSFGIALTHLKRLDEAVEQFTEALRIDPEHVPALKGIAVALGRRGETDAAVEHLTRAVESSPQDRDARYNLGRLLMRRGDLARAGKEFSEVLRLDPDNLRARESLGIVLYQQGRIPEAVEQLSEVLRAEPEREDLRLNLKRLQELADRGGSR